jgi:hypothetical protein
MKSCPTCNRTYPDDTLAFCLVDGSVLSAPYESEPDKSRPSSRSTTTEILSPSTSSGGVGSPPSTIVARPPKVPSLHAQPAALQPEEKRSKLPWFLFGGAILLVGILALIVLALMWPSQRSATLNNNNSRATSTPMPTPSTSACGHSVDPKIYDKWTELGGEAGRFGCPVADETQAPVSPKGATGRWIRFEKGDGGYLILHQSGTYSGQAVEVSGCMYKLYSSLGGTGSWLGFPISDGREISTGVQQDFEGGYTKWDSTTYRCEAHKN